MTRRPSGPSGGKKKWWQKLIPGGTKGVSSRVVADIDDKNTQMFLAACFGLFLSGIVCTAADLWMSWEGWASTIAQYLPEQWGYVLTIVLSLVPTLGQIAWTLAAGSSGDLKPLAMQRKFLILFITLLVFDSTMDIVGFLQRGMPLWMAVAMVVIVFYFLSEICLTFFGAITWGVYSGIKKKKGGPSRGPASRPAMASRPTQSTRPTPGPRMPDGSSSMVVPPPRG
jgi:hypothetical protein